MTVDLTRLKVGDTIVRRDGEVRIITNIHIYNHNHNYQGYYCSLDWSKKTPNSLQNSNVAYTQDGYWDSRRVTDSWDIVDIIPQKEPNDIINIHKAKTFKRTFNSKDSPTLNLVNCALGLGGEANIDKLYKRFPDKFSEELASKKGELEMSLITREKYLKGKDRTYANEWSTTLSKNTDKTISIINVFLEDIGVDWDVQVSSGWQPSSMNQSDSGDALNSNHITCLAVDIVDLAPFPLMKLILDNLDKAEKHGIYFEDFRWTSSWIHCQIIPPQSKKRIYIPNSNQPQSPNKWSGKYDSKYNK